jgi:metal-sulfur cluster biosynthetic enzyme
MNAELVKQELEFALHEVFDPETGVNVFDLGLIYGVDWEADSGEAEVRMTFTTPACPAGGVMTEGVERRLALVPGVRSVRVEVGFEPAWTPERITPAGREALGW